MKLRKGRPRYTIPPHSEITGVYIEGNQKHNQMTHYVLQQCKLEDLPKTSVLAFPTIFSVLHNIIEFWPVPDRPYTVKIRYTPPIAEF